MTLSTDVLLSDTGAVARRLQGFEVRPQQLVMAAAVERAFEERQRLFVEAGTGVGKSFAYLIPAIRRIVERDERVVVATNTISLQEQLVEKDIPLLNAVIPEEFTAVLVKGRGNYVSLRRLMLASRRQDRLLVDEGLEGLQLGQPGSARVRLLQQGHDRARGGAVAQGNAHPAAGEDPARPVRGHGVVELEVARRPVD